MQGLLETLGKHRTGIGPDAQAHRSAQKFDEKRSAVAFELGCAEAFAVERPRRARGAEHTVGRIFERELGAFRTHPFGNARNRLGQRGEQQRVQQDQRRGAEYARAA